jgi:mRNA interferase MazF
VLVRFPCSGLSRSKLRPAVALAEVGQGDWILRQITSNPHSDVHAFMLFDGSFRQGGLQRTSYVRPGKLFTANHDLMEAEVGLLKAGALGQVIKSTPTCLGWPYPIDPILCIVDTISATANSLTTSPFPAHTWSQTSLTHEAASL